MDQYIGGVEHATLHLLYARFFTKFLRDTGWLLFDEPFTRLFNQGIVHKEAKRMSKSQGNVVTVDEVSKKYGIDTARLFLMFVASPDKDMEWDEHGIEGAHRSVAKLMKLFDRVGGSADALMEHKVNKTLKFIEESYEGFAFNKAIVAFMELVTYLSGKDRVPKHILETLVLMIAPVMPHIAEELWNKLGRASLVARESWPIVQESKINDTLEQEEQQVEKTMADIRQVLTIVQSKGQAAKKVYLYVIPNELSNYNSESMSDKIGLPVKIYAVNAKDKHYPTVDLTEAEAQELEDHKKKGYEYQWRWKAIDEAYFKPTS
jgi:leucyl-tRNA synthetase